MLAAEDFHESAWLGPLAPMVAALKNNGLYDRPVSLNLRETAIDELIGLNPPANP